MHQNIENIHLLPKLFAHFREVNLGIALVGTYFLLEFGSVQGLFPVVRQIRMPLIIGMSTLLYAIYLTAVGRVNFNSSTTKSFTFLCFFIISYSALSTINLEAKSETIKIFLIYWANYIVIVTCTRSVPKFILLIDIWLFSVALSSFHGIMQGGLIYGNRWLKDENHISLIAAVALPFAFFLFREYSDKNKKICYIICMALYIGVIVVAHSRGGALGLLVVVLLCWLCTKKRVRSLAIMIIVALIVLHFSPSEFMDEMETLKQGTKEETAADRIYLWGLALKVFYKNPIIGVGPMNHPDYLIRIGGFSINEGAGQVVHSTPIQWLAEKGIIGTLILMHLLFCMYRNWKRAFNITASKETKFDAKTRQTFISIAHSCAFAQIGFWFCSIFLSLLPYPFYWCLVPFSESWNNLLSEYADET